MTISEFLKQPSPAGSVPDGTPTESDWLLGWECRLNSGRVHVADPSDANCDMYGCVVELPPGSYRLDVRLMLCSGWWKVSQLRCTAVGAGGFASGGVVGEVATDVASVAVYDFDVFTRVDTYDDARWLSIDEARARLRLLHVLPMADAPNSEICLVESGEGDGVYQVCELLREGTRQGFWIKFLPHR